MKILKRMLLIHWFYFTHEIIEFDHINFLTGRNSSGKSTIIDALQLVLLSDTSGTFFNKAASGRGTRTLTGYLRGELGDNEGAGFRYLRNGRFTSYITLEFYDDIKRNYFTVGCCFDTFGENDCQRLFFEFDDPLPAHEFLDKNTPLTIEGLRAYIRAHYKSNQSYATHVNHDFREFLCGRLGALQPKRFSNLLKKAVSFNPNVDIQQFITEFVCGDEQKIHIEDMKENIRSYDTLKKEAALLKERIALLSDIFHAHGEFTKQAESERIYQYLINRAELEMKETELGEAWRKAGQWSDECDALKEKVVNAEADEKQLQEERDNLKLQLDSNETARRLADLQKQIIEKKRQRDDLRNKYEQFSALLRRKLFSWRTFISTANEKISETDTSLLEPLLCERVESLRAEGEGFLVKMDTLRTANAENLIDWGTEKLSLLSGEADDYRNRCISLASRINDARDEITHRRTALKKEKESLEKGIYQFPKDAVDLKEAIEGRLRTRYGAEARAFIVAEAAEIRNDRWRNVIEGYLNTQRFYVIVEPEHFHMAFELYDTVKHQKNVFDTGLVDTEKLKRMSPTRDEGSLVEELETENPTVRMFLDYTLGRVRKCDGLHDLRKYKTSITADGMLNQHLVIRAMDPRRWKDPAIGQSGARLRLEKVTAELLQLSKEASAYITLIAAFRETKDFSQFPQISGFEAEQILHSAKGYQEIPQVEALIQRLKTDAESIDKSEIETLRCRFAERDEALKNFQRHIRVLDGHISALKERLQGLHEKTLPTLTQERDRLQAGLKASHSEEWVEKIGRPRYERELSSRGGADRIYKAFPRELAEARNKKNGAWVRTRDLRINYNDTYKMGYDVNTEDNAAYDQAWREYGENQLPDYEAKIEDTREKAFQQFHEDVLSRLQSNISNARRQINEINEAMRDVSFGEDTYRFRATANPEFKRYHDMIVDEMLLTGGYNLLSAQFNAKYKDELAELFSIITHDDVGANAVGYEDYEKRVQRFTDYKTYLNFDLEVIKPNGESERLSKTMGKKSGGETQTPFYIAVLASFVQLYRAKRGPVPDTVRLILFDEAFSKMDGERIIQSIALLRRFNFQVILAAPPDKIADIATLVDRNIGVLREGRKTCVRAFDPRQWEAVAHES